jgi:hypothetical protein
MTGPTETRRRLPNRRGHELLSFEHGGIPYTAGVGRFENGELAREVTKEEAIEMVMARRNCSREQAVELIKRLEDEYPEKEFSKGN